MQGEDGGPEDWKGGNEIEKVELMTSRYREKMVKRGETEKGKVRRMEEEIERI